MTETEYKTVKHLIQAIHITHLQNVIIIIITGISLCSQ